MTDLSITGNIWQSVTCTRRHTINKISILLQKLRELEAIYTSQLKLTNSELFKLPEGGLVINKHKKRTFFYKWHNNTQRGITSNPDLVKKLARKRFLKLRKHEYEISLELLKSIIGQVESAEEYHNSDRLCAKMTTAGLDINALTWTDSQYQANKWQSQNPFRREDLRYATNGGIMVRSISEKVWGDLYEQLGIPYQYEREFCLDVTDMPGVKGTYEHNGRFYKHYYPDFTLIMADDSLFIHEHLGRIDKDEYRANTGERFIAITLNKIVYTDRFLVTYPKDVEDTSKFQQILLTNVLPLV